MLYLWYTVFMMNEKLYSPKEASKILGIHIRTLQRWDNEGVLKVIRTPNNRRKIPQSEIDRLLNKSNENNTKIDTVAIYARVSSHEQKQKGDLDRQVGSILTNITSKKHKNIVTITDVGSGLNDKRKGLLQLMELAKNKEINTIYITYRDRLTRFGFNYLDLYFKSYNVDIVVLNDIQEDKSPQQELVDDLMSIIASFSGKLYGLRSGKNKIVKDKVKDVINSNLD